MTGLRCEIRVVTCRRPTWLKRALSSLQAQTHENWVARVFDDSPTQEGRAVVGELNDARIAYHPNTHNLGAAANLDQAFQVSALAGGSFACILEDDNWLLPDFLAANICLLQNGGGSILLRNQEIWAQHDGAFHPTGRTTRGTWFQEGDHSVPQLRAQLFFHEGISNGGLFWRTSSSSRLQIGAHVRITGIQEYCRTLGIRERLWFAAEPLAVWAELEPAAVIRGAHSNRTFARAIQQIRVALFRHYGGAILDEARAIAERTRTTATLDRSLADLTLAQRRVQRLPVSRASLKAFLRYHLVADPLKSFFASFSL